MSLKAVDGILSSLKSCQTDLGTGMDIVTDIAMDLAETQMEAMILECAKLDSEINYFVDIVQQATAEVTPQHPEAMFSLSAKVKEQFAERITQLSNADLNNHQKVAAFKESIKNSLQVEMVNPMKNKKCNHHYDEEAILSLIKTKQSQKKRCPVVGCGNGDVKESDLIPDQMLRRKIQNQKRQSNKT
uniref:E3 SUMO-protein ligase NSE2 n=1 Tax=Xiphophorus couchianus TaxID=32473 RepID=A0A3B5MBX6_9TELE